MTETSIRNMEHTMNSFDEVGLAMNLAYRKHGNLYHAVNCVHIDYQEVDIEILIAMWSAIDSYVDYS